MGATLVQELVLTDRDFRQIKELVYKHCGINLTDSKKQLVRSRLAKRLRVGGFKTIPEYMRHVLADKTGREFSTFIDSLSTNVTSFFREPKHFDYLCQEFLPRLFDRKRKQNKFKIRCWSAACSSGEEPYSLAITLLDETSGKGRWDIKILATDISTTILERAKKGAYSEERVKPVSTMQRNRYLTTQRIKGEKVYEVNRPLRDIVVFKYLNLMEDWPIRISLDFIFCRNVMIYFDKQTQEALINRYWDILDSGGVLFTGHSESLTGIQHKFQYIQPTIYLKP
jgi:chemotaxis protein methyltransferase CheR